MNTEKVIGQKALRSLIAPIISEKSTDLGEKGIALSYYISQDATKEDVKQAIEFFFKVEVKSVRVLNCKGKVKRFGRFTGRRKNMRKAYISLKESLDNVLEQEVK